MEMPSPVLVKVRVNDILKSAGPADHHLDLIVRNLIDFIFDSKKFSDELTVSGSCTVEYYPYKTSKFMACDYTGNASKNQAPKITRRYIMAPPLGKQ